MNATTAIKIVGAAAKVAVIAAAACKVYVCARLAHAIAKADVNSDNTNNN